MILTFALLVAFGVISSAIDEDDFFCYQSPPNCFTPKVHVDFPDSVESLDKICPILIPRFKCLSDFKNECSDKGIEVHSQYKNIDNIIGLLVEACDKESKFHKELTLYLPCTEEALMIARNTCRPLIKEELEKIKRELNLDFAAEHLSSDDENMAKYMCMYEGLEMSCFVASTSVRCGEKTGDYVRSVFDRTGFFSVICPGQNPEEIKEKIASVQTDMKLRIAAEEIIYQNK